MSPRVDAEIFGPYRIERVLARGGMGVVYIASSPFPEHPRVALKRLRADVRAVPVFLARFERECAIARSLKHPNLVACLDAGRIEDVPFMAAELVIGPDLGTLAREIGPLPVGLGLRIGLDVAAGLAHIHEARTPDGAPRRLVHRDVAPGNVLVGLDGMSKLGDFGLAKSELLDLDPLTKTGTVLGTPRFLAPERLLGRLPSPAADVYGLGAVLYHLLAGRGPYLGNAREVLARLVHGPPEPLALAHPAIPAAVTEAVDDLMHRALERRPASGRAALRRLEALDGAWSHAEVADWMEARFGGYQQPVEAPSLPRPETRAQPLGADLDEPAAPTGRGPSPVSPVPVGFAHLDEPRTDLGALWGGSPSAATGGASTGPAATHPSAPPFARGPRDHHPAPLTGPAEPETDAALGAVDSSVLAAWEEVSAPAEDPEWSLAEPAPLKRPPPTWPTLGSTSARPYPSASARALEPTACLSAPTVASEAPVATASLSAQTIASGAPVAPGEVSRRPPTIGIGLGIRIGREEVTRSPAEKERPALDAGARGSPPTRPSSAPRSRSLARRSARLFVGALVAAAVAAALLLAGAPSSESLALAERVGAALVRLERVRDEATRGRLREALSEIRAHVRAGALRQAEADLERLETTLDSTEHGSPRER